MDCANDILPSGMVNGSMWEIFIEAPISGPLIGAKQADFVGDGFSHDGVKRCGLDVCDHAGRDISLAADGAYDWRFAGADSSRSTAAAFIPMPIFAKPPTKVSSTSTMPPGLSVSCMRAVRTLWHMSQAVLYDPKPI
jgi:hypothetical protein